MTAWGRQRHFDFLTCGRSITYSCWLTPQILDGPLWRSFAAPATASYVCSTLRPVIPEAIVLRHVWPELGRIRPLRQDSPTLATKTQRLNRANSFMARNANAAPDSPASSFAWSISRLNVRHRTGLANGAGIVLDPGAGVQFVGAGL
jgi:hypothetical protein